jgi:hypothetical protein
LETAFCPLWPIIPERATPELLALQAKLAAQMSYRRVVETMREFLPVSEKFNHVTVRNRTLRVGTRIDAIELPGAQPRNPHYRMDPGDRRRVRPRMFRFVGCLPSTTDMSAGHKRMRAGVVQIPMEETAECSGVAGTFSAMGIEEVGCGVGLTQRWGKAG